MELRNRTLFVFFTMISRADLKHYFPILIENKYQIYIKKVRLFHKMLRPGNEMIENKGAPKTRRTANQEAGRFSEKGPRKKVKTTKMSIRTKPRVEDDYMEDDSNSANSDSMNESSHSSSNFPNKLSKSDDYDDLSESNQKYSSAARNQLQSNFTANTIVKAKNRSRDMTTLSQSLPKSS